MTRTTVITLAAILLSPMLDARHARACTRSDCHEKLLKAKFVHGPLGANKCGFCHKPMVKGLKGPEHRKGQMSVPLGRATLCNKCHEEIKKELRGKHVHKPVAKIECVFCHDPHKSSYRYRLRANRKITPKKPFCNLCHKRLQFKGKRLHKPLAEGRCNGCHRIHASDQQHMLVLSQEKLCFKCHKVNWRKRPILHGPVDAGMCGSCHDPHAAKETKLLKHPLKKICQSCHKKEETDKSHGIVKGYKQYCLGCHDAHGSQNRHLLKGK